MTQPSQGMPPKRLLTPDWAPRIASLALSQQPAGYSVAGIDHLDHELDNYRKVRIPARKMEDAFYVFGCFLGEVMVRHAYGIWQVTDEQYRAATGIPFVVSFPDGRWVDPIAHVTRRFQNKKEATLVDFYRASVTRRQDTP